MTRVAPGPKGHVLLGSLPEFRKDPLTFLAGLREQHGDVARFRLVTDPCFLLSHPELVRLVLRERSGEFRKAFFFDKVKSLLGNGLLSYPFEDEFWRGRRRLAQPPFRPSGVAGFSGMWAAATEELIERWHAEAERGNPIDAFDHLLGHSLDLASRTLFGITGHSADGERVNTSFTICLEHLMHKVQSALDVPERIPTARNRRFRRAKRNLNEVIERLVQQRRRAGQEVAADFLSSYVRSHDSEPERGSDRQLHDDLLTLFIAGFETNASAIAWALWTIAQQPELQARLQTQVDQVLSGRSPSLQDLPRLPLIRMTLQETMRLRPPAWWIARAATADLVVRGYPIPRGSTVIVSQYVTHRHPEFWPDPERFDPERFNDAQIRERPPMAYFPFGDGPRGCIGEHFATVQLQIVLAMILTHFEIRPDPGHEVQMWPAITMRPTPSVPLYLTRRQPAKHSAATADVAPQAAT